MKRSKLFALLIGICLVLVLVALPFMSACGPSAPGEQEEEEEEEEEPEVKSSPKRRKKPIETEPEEDDEPEEEAPKTSRKAKPEGSKNKCPHGHKFGTDCEEFDECDECDSWNECIEAKN